MIRTPKGKLVTLSKLPDLIASLKEKNKKIITTNGCFDLLHVGHVRYLFEAKKLGDVLIVGVNSDLSVKKIKGEDRPINTEESRAEVLGGLESVDYVCIFPEETPIEFLKIVKPSLHVKGGDYTGKELPEKKIIEENGGKIQFISFIDGFSTSKTIEKLRN